MSDLKERCRGVAELRWNADAKMGMVGRLLAEVAARVEDLEREVAVLSRRLSEVAERPPAE